MMITISGFRILSYLDMNVCPISAIEFSLHICTGLGSEGTFIVQVYHVGGWSELYHVFTVYDFLPRCLAYWIRLMQSMLPDHTVPSVPSRHQMPVPQSWVRDLEDAVRIWFCPSPCSYCHGP